MVTDGSGATAAAAPDRSPLGPPGLRIRLLGGFEVSVHGRPLRKLRTRQGNRLLALLALVPGRGVERSELAGRLFADSSSEAAALGSLRRSLTDLRDALGPEAWRLRSVSQFTLELDLSGDAWCDVTEFDRAISAGTPESLDRAMALYAGPLMPDLDAVEDPEGGLRYARDHRRLRFLEAIERRAARRQRDGEIDGAIDDLRRLLVADPVREAASYSLMELLLREKGDRPGVITEYNRLRRQLSRLVDMKPEPRTRALYERAQSQASKKESGPAAAWERPRAAGSQGHPVSGVAMYAPPARTHLVTYLMADLLPEERSGAEDVAEGLATARSAYEALMRRAVESAEGAILRFEGNRACAAFFAPSDALVAMLEAQRLAAGQLGPGSLHPQVRLAAHAALGEARSDGAAGFPAENQAARQRLTHLLETAHGRQSLLSAAMVELVRDCLPDGMGLLSLGGHRLPGRERPETVHQLLHPDLAAAFPPLRSLRVTPNNLPLQITRFIGREAEISAIRSLLRDSRLLTLTGTGGTGKTRLALQAAADALDDYPDGVWFIDLAPVTDGALVARTVASVLDIHEQWNASALETMLGALVPKRLLLLLDNCEHLLPECARLAAALLRTCPEVSVLTTSREALTIFGERLYHVPTLSLPEKRRIPSLAAADLMRYEAVRLFLDRAALIDSRVVATDANASLLAELCSRLDGIPLAIELAAARVRSLTVEQINEKVDNRFRLLTSGDRAALPRQRTLRALIDWSYDLLTENEKTLLARLSVFAGGWTLEAAESVCGWGSIEDKQVLDLLTSLADKSLVLAEEAAADAGGSATRYRMLETMRQYAAEKLVPSGDSEAVRTRHGAFFLALAEEAWPHLDGPDQGAWLNRLETEHDNSRVALDSCAAGAQGAAEQALAGLRLSGALWRFWWVRGYLSEGREQLARARAARPLLHGDAADARKATAAALRAEGAFAFGQGDSAAARSLWEESLTLYREIGDKSGIALTLGNLGSVAADPAAMRTLYEESLRLFRESGDTRGIALTLGNLANVAYGQGDYAAVRTICEESLNLYRATGDKDGIARALGNLGILAYSEGDHAEAQLLSEESLNLRRALGDKVGIANTLVNLGLVACARGDYAAALQRHQEGLRLFREAGVKGGIAYGLEGIASVCVRQGDLCRAALLWAAAGTLRESIRAPLSPTEQATQGAAVETVRSSLGGKLFAAAWEEGSALNWEEAVDYSLDTAKE